MQRLPFVEATMAIISTHKGAMQCPEYSLPLVMFGSVEISLEKSLLQ